MASPETDRTGQKTRIFEHHPRSLERIQDALQRLLNLQRDGNPHDPIENGYIAAVSSEANGAPIHLAILKQGASRTNWQDVNDAIDMGNVAFNGFVQTSEEEPQISVSLQHVSFQVPATLALIGEAKAESN